jgi:hypothetical protein
MCPVFVGLFLFFAIAVNFVPKFAGHIEKPGAVLNPGGGSQGL